MTKTITQRVLFHALDRKPVEAVFDQPHGSSDGGAILLKGIDQQLGLTPRLASSLRDNRQMSKVQHRLLDLVQERVYTIACGYEDGNDAARLAEDPIAKLLLGRDPIVGRSLPSQASISRFENAPRSRDLVRGADAVAEVIVSHHAKRLKGKARLITIDLDGTDDPTHGQQEFSFFNGYYDHACYVPLIATVQFDEETELYAVGALLRPGNAAPSSGAIAVLRRLLDKLHRYFPNTTFRVRLDGGFSTPLMLEYLELEKVEYVVGMASNAVLEQRAVRQLGKARAKSEQTGKTEAVYGETLYAARTWRHRRRVIIKAQVVRHPERDPKNNPRFVITNLRLAPEQVYARYRQRGCMENRIKELHHGLQMDRCSCSSFLANQFRVLMTLAAYVLMQEIRRRAALTNCADAQVWTLRERLLKLGSWVESSVRRIVIHLPLNYPWLRAWKQIAESIGALAG